MKMRATIGAVGATALLAGLTACGGAYGYNDVTAQDAVQASPAGPSADAPPTSPPPFTIVMKTYAFIPTAIETAPGKVWAIDNQDAVIHDVRTKNNKTIFSGDVAAGAKGTVKMPTKKGKYKALCYYHQNMIIDITVK